MEAKLQLQACIIIPNYISINTQVYLEMGNLVTVFCGEKHMVEMIVNMLETANRVTMQEQRYSTLLANHKETLKRMVRNGKSAREVLDEIVVDVVPCPVMTDFDPSFNEQIEKEVKLILSSPIEQSEQSSEMRQSKQKSDVSRGCIIFSNAYYYGEISNKKAHGRGTLYFDPSLQAYEVEGSWENDSLKKGTLFKKNSTVISRIKQKIFQIELLNGQRSAVVKSKDFQYSGSIKLEGSKMVNEILTGFGTVTYPNGDSYHGQLVNGRYQTSDNKSAEFRYAQGQCKSFKGFYKAGLKDDNGVFEFDISGVRFKLSVSFTNGVPVGNGCLQFDDDNTEHRVQVGNSSLLIQSQIRP